MNGVPDFLAFVAHGKLLNVHGCVEAARRSVVPVTELSGLLKQQGATVPPIVNTFCADSQDELVLFAFCLANMAPKRKKMHGQVSAARAADPDFLDAKKQELASWDRYGGYELVPDHGQTVATTRWLNAEQVADDGTVTPKPCLVARGFQEADKDLLDTASPTVDRGVWRVMLAMAAVYVWLPSCFDISTAYLQGGQITRDVFLRPSPEIGEPGMVMKLNQTVYGLVDAPLQWYEALNEGVVVIGGVRLPYDKYAWMWYAREDSLLAMLCAHVDDLYCSADPSFEDSLLVKLGALFPVVKEKRGDFIYCGLPVSTEPDENGQVTSIMLEQRAYIDKIVPKEISHSTGSHNRCLERQEHSNYRGIVGALLWVSTSTRPDHAYRICKLSQQTGVPMERHTIQTNKLLKPMKKQALVLRYPQLTGALRLIGYHDSSWGNAEDGHTVGGWIWVLSAKDASGKEMFSPLQWRSRTLGRVVKSTSGG